MDKLSYGYCRVSRAADDGALNLDTQQHAVEAVGIRPELIYREVASGGSLDRQGWIDLVDAVRLGDTIMVIHLDRIGRNLVESLQATERLTEQGVGIVALDAGIDTSEANPAARLQIAMMLAFAEWERRTVRERSIAGQLRARKAGKTIGRQSLGQVSRSLCSAAAPTRASRHKACRRLSCCSFDHLQGHRRQRNLRLPCRLIT